MAPQKEIKVLQINVGHSHPSQDIALKTACEMRADIICVTEPYLYKGSVSGTPGWNQVATKNNPTSAILIRKTMTYKVIQCKPEAVAIEVDGVVVDSVYATPNGELGPVLNLLDAVPYHRRIITGDFNCRIPAFSKRKARPRDDEFLEYVFEKKLEIVNENKPTCTHQGRYTINDYTLATDPNTVNSWNVLEKESLSDHLYIIFNIELEPSKKKTETLTKIGMDEDLFGEFIIEAPILLPYTTAERTEANAHTISTWLEFAVTVATKKKEMRPEVAWWNDNLEHMQHILKTLNRKIHKCKNPATIVAIQEERKTLKAEYRTLIVKSKIEAWRSFTNCNRPWGKPYKAVAKKQEYMPGIPQVKMPNGRLTTSDDEAAQCILWDKFPHVDHPPIQPEIPTRPLEDVPEVTDLEVTRLLKSVKNRSAPGLDNVNYKALKKVNKKHPTLLPELYTQCLRWSTFPSRWKEGKLALIPKGKDGMDTFLTGSYRPLTLLSVIGKTLERVCLSRMSANVEKRLSNNQYGFRKGRSCEDCLLECNKRLERMKSSAKVVVAVSLDIKGAFDHMLYGHILDGLEKFEVPEYIRKIIRSYLYERTIEYGGITRALECGCPQGSVLGPMLWDIGYDSTLRMLEKRWISHLVYADDTLLLIAGETLKEVQLKADREVKNLAAEMSKKGLILNVSKTEILLLKTRRRRDGSEEPETNATMRILGTEITLKDLIKYLGVWISNTLSWTPHLLKVLEKGMKLLPKIVAIARNTFGYSSSARRVMLMGTIGAHVKYASAVFASSLQLKKNAEIIDKLDRRMLLCYGRFYRTVSYIPATIICGWLPLKYKVMERALEYSKKHGKALTNPVGDTNGDKYLWRENSMRIWQEEWNASEKGKWTKALLPMVEDNEEEEVPAPSFWLSQGLSGHGVFASYLYKFKRRRSPVCRCGAEIESPEHIFRQCRLYKEGRPSRLDGRSEDTRKYIEVTVRRLWEAEQTMQRSAN